MKKWITLMICVCFMLFGNVEIANAATPRVMLSDYSIKEEQVISGEEFNLTLTLRNTAARNVKNLKVTLMTDNGELLPVEGAGTAYVEQIDAQSETDLTFKMMAIDGLEEKSYKLKIKTEYENTSGWEYTVEEMIFIPVTHEQRISVTDVFIANDQLQLGDIMEISAVVNNMGAGTLYNVTVNAVGPNMELASTYLGNIEAGKSATADILTKALLLTNESTGKNELVISYEDQKKNSYEMKYELGNYGMIRVAEPVYENLEKVKESSDYSDLFRQVAGWGIGIAAVIGIILLWKRRMKKKQEMLDEFMK